MRVECPRSRTFPKQAEWWRRKLAHRFFIRPVNQRASRNRNLMFRCIQQPRWAAELRPNFLGRGPRTPGVSAQATAWAPNASKTYAGSGETFKRREPAFQVALVFRVSRRDILPRGRSDCSIILGGIF